MPPNIFNLKALQGVIKPHDRLMLQQLLDDIAHYRQQIIRIETQISNHTNQMNGELMANLKEVKGIGRQSTEIILAEVGFSRRMQAKKAIVAIARKLMRVVYKIIKGTMKYREYGSEYFIEKLQQRKPQRTITQTS